MCLLDIGRRRGQRSIANLARGAAHFLGCAMDFTIGAVTPTEIPALLEMIRELARFEQLEHEVETTVALLREALFGPQPVAGVLLARRGAQPVGYALYFFTFSSFVGRPGVWLDDLYVRPAFRRRGVGRALLQAVAKIGADRQCGRFEWTALNWNQNALDFYRSLGAQAMDQWVLLRVKAEGLRRLAGGDAEAGSGRSASSDAALQECGSRGPKSKR